MNIMHFLTPKAQVEYIFYESTVRQGLEKMRYHGFSAIPVIDKEGHYKGTVTEGDFLWALYNDQKPSLKKLETTPIASIIHKKYTAVNAGAPAWRAAPPKGFGAVRAANTGQPRRR